MEVLFLGICTHLGSIGRNKHRVALPESDPPYEVQSIVIPKHDPLLSIRRGDIASGAAIPTGDRSSGPTVISYDLRQSELRIETGGANFSAPNLSCLPSLERKTKATLRPWIRLGWHPSYVSTYVDVDGGAMMARVENNDKGEPARHTVLHADLTEPFTVRWRKKGAGWTSLLLEPSAQITISNHEAAACDPCDEHDYLLHYRLTNLHRELVAPDKFRPDEACVASEPITLRDFPLPGDITSTLLTCSNSNYP